MSPSKSIDVLCVGHASYDLIFSVAQHPAADEKIVATAFSESGGGPAANAAVCVARLGYSAAFGGYLGLDSFGEKHLQELQAEQVDTRCILRGNSATPLSTIIVKPDGQRALINYKGATQALAAGQIDFSSLKPKVILFDGHEVHLSLALAAQARAQQIPLVLDAGSLHAGTETLMDKVDYLACSEKFACQYAGDVTTALARLAKLAPHVIITLGEQGLLWRRGDEEGSLAAYKVKAIDSTGAGDAFHGALAAGIAQGLAWDILLRYASAAGALCCTQMGARAGLPTLAAVTELIATQLPNSKP